MKVVAEHIIETPNSLKKVTIFKELEDGRFANMSDPRSIQLLSKEEFELIINTEKLPERRLY